MSCGERGTRGVYGVDLDPKEDLESLSLPDQHLRRQFFDRRQVIRTDLFLRMRKEDKIACEEFSSDTPRSY